MGRYNLALLIAWEYVLMRITGYLIFCIMLAALAGGCSESAPQPNKRDQATKDPMSYDPAQNDRGNISGGGILDFDKKAFGKDVDSALNP